MAKKVSVQPGEKLRKNSVVLDLDFHKPSKERKGNLEGVDIDSDPDSLRLVKKFIDSEHYTKCESVRAKTKASVRKFAFASKILKDGCYLVPVACVEDIEPVLKEAKEEYDGASDALKESWKEIVADAKKRLKSQFDSKNYPSAENIRSRFSMSWSYREYLTPTSATLGEALFEAEAKKAKDSWARMEQEVSLGFRLAFYDLLSHLNGKLKASADGERKVLKQAAVDKLLEFMQTFAKRNILGDAQMQKLVDQAKKVVQGKSLEQIKASKEAVSSQLGKIEKTLDKLIDTQKRAFDF